MAAVDLKDAIALIERGDITFSEKVANAAAAGAVGALIFNNLPGGYAGTLGERGGDPGSHVTREDGLPLKEASSTPVRLYVTPKLVLYPLQRHLDGQPSRRRRRRAWCSRCDRIWTPTACALILKQTATDLGVRGRDDLYGDGLVNAAAAVKAARELAAIP